jgi:hypothetical protein
MDILGIELIKFSNMNNRLQGLKYDIENFEKEYANNSIRTIEERKEYLLGCLYGLATANLLSSKEVDMLSKKVQHTAILIEVKR